MTDINEFFDADDASWWAPLKVWHDRRIKTSEHLPHMPEEIRSKMLRNKVAANRNWNHEELKWFRDDTTGLFFVEERWVMFEETEDMTLFILRFQGAKS